MEKTTTETTETTTEQTPNISYAKQVNEEVLDWLNRVRDAGDVRVAIIRKKPERMGGRNIAGHITTLEGELPDDIEDLIQDQYGGGKYQIKISRPTASGKFVYGGAATVQIAGDPKWHTDYSGPDPANGSNGSNGRTAIPEEAQLSSKAMDQAAQFAHADRERANRLEERLLDAQRRPDPMLEFMKEEMRELRDELRAAKNAKPDHSFQDTVLTEMVKGRTSELDGIRERHRSEIETMRTSFNDQIARIEDRNERRSDLAREDAKRSLHDQKLAYEGQIRTIESSRDTQLALLNSQISRLEGELGSVREELRGVRSEKTQGPLDQIQMIIALKEAFSELTDSGEDPPATWEKVLDRVTPMMAGLAQRLAPPTPAAGQLQEQTATPAEAPTPTEEEVGFTKKELTGLLDTLENAITNGTEPEVFANSIRGMFPGKLIATISSMGVDNLVGFVGQQEKYKGSIITQAVGRSFLRKVIHILSGGESSTIDPEE